MSDEPWLPHPGLLTGLACLRNAACRAHICGRSKQFHSPLFPLQKFAYIGERNGCLNPSPMMLRLVFSVCWPNFAAAIIYVLCVVSQSLHNIFLPPNLSCVKLAIPYLVAWFPWVSFAQTCLVHISTTVSCFCEAIAAGDTQPAFCLGKKNNNRKRQADFASRKICFLFDPNTHSNCPY